MAVEKTRPIRIAHLQLLPILSGAQKVTLDELTRLNREAFEPFVVCKEEGPFTDALRAAGIPFFCLPELTREISPRKDAQALWKLVSLFRQERVDIVHTHSSKTGILGRLAGRLAGVPLVLHTVHGFAFPAARSKAKAAFYYLMEWMGARLADALIVLNPEDLETAHKRLGVPLGKLLLIPNGVDLDFYKPLGEKEREEVRGRIFGLEGNQTAVGVVGRLWPQKNPECFVKAAIRILQKNRGKIGFFLIGDGEERPRLEAQIRDAGFEKEIRLLGWRGDVGKILGGLDVFALPSLWEGMPLAILEAMAVGLPVAVSDIPGNRDLVEEGVTGFLFKPGDEADLAEKIERLVADPPLARRLGAAGRKKAEQFYSIGERVKTMEKLYLENLARKKGDPHARG